MTLTERAAEHVKNFLGKKETALGIRISIKTTGCSGYSYVVDTADQINEEDQVFETHGVKLIVEDKNIKFLKGTEMDYVREGMNEGFKFNNPNVAETCGCGESFTVE